MANQPEFDLTDLMGGPTVKLSSNLSVPITPTFDTWTKIFEMVNKYVDLFREFYDASEEYKQEKARTEKIYSEAKELIELAGSSEDVAGVVRACSEAYPYGAAPKDNISFISKLVQGIVLDGDALKLLSLCTGTETEVLSKLPGQQVIVLLQTVLEVNWSFFSQALSDLQKAIAGDTQTEPSEEESGLKAGDEKPQD